MATDVSEPRASEAGRHARPDSAVASGLRPRGAPFIGLATWASLLIGMVGCQPRAPHPSAAPNPAGAEVARQENAHAFDLIEMGKYPDAEAALRRALEADDGFGPAHNNLGLVYYHADRLYSAANEFDRATRLMPRQGEPWNNLGLVYERAGKLDEAVTAYGRARDLEPNNAEFLANLARTRVKRGDRDDETRQLLQQVAARDARAAWRDWARELLVRMQPDAPDDEAPTTQRATPKR